MEEILNPVEDGENQNEVDYTVYLEDIIDNQGDITNNQISILTEISVIEENQQYLHEMQKGIFTACVGLSVLILFIGTCKFIKNIF